MPKKPLKKINSKVRKIIILCALLIIIEAVVGLIVKNIIFTTGLLMLNAAGFLFLYLSLYQKSFNKTGTRRADLSVKIAHETLPYLRRGLNEKNAEAIARIIQETAQVAAVSITDCEKQLAYLGAGCDRHHPGDRILTEATKEVIRTSEFKVVQTQKELNCPMSNVCDCPLEGAVIVPLICRGGVVGTLKIYETQGGRMSPDLIRLTLGMGQILSLQVELAELDHQASLVTEAKLDALQAQINPHFFFNVINTIIATSRINPNRARRLLVHLAELFRQALKFKSALISINEEMILVRSYLFLEKARFGRKLKISLEIPEDLYYAEVPRLSIQPLVENAVKHGIAPMVTNGNVIIRAQKTEAEDGMPELLVEVEDNGAGIGKERLQDVLLPGIGSGNGVGLANVHARLKGLYGEAYGLVIKSNPGRGTIVSMRVPLSGETEKEVS